MPNEAVTVANEAKMKLTDFSQMEPIVNGYARLLCKKHSINPNHFEVFLCRDLDGNIMKILGGSVVSIFLQWPESQASINTLLGDAFRFMRNYNVRRTMEVVPYAYTRTQASEIKKMWKKTSFTDESDVILDLIPKQRLRVHKVETTTVEDVVTGEKVSFVHEYPTDRYDLDATNLWMKLSRLVRDKQPDEPFESEPQSLVDSSLTPEQHAEADRLTEESIQDDR